MAGQVEEGKKDLSSKGLFPLLNYRPLLGTEQKRKVPEKGLEKGDGVGGSGKEPIRQKFFPSFPSPTINLYQEQSAKKCRPDIYLDGIAVSVL